MLEIKSSEEYSPAKIVIIGIGGAGNNAINRMIDENTVGVEFLGINSDVQALKLCKAPKILQIGEKLTRGLGCGGVPEVGQKAAEESIDEIMEAVKGADMVFITCGMGGGTGTGAAPIVAKIAKDLSILTVGVVSKPFHFEANKRMVNALTGIDRLKPHVDTLIVIPNEKLLQALPHRTTMTDALKKADEVLQQSVRGITDTISVNGGINLDFADVETIMRDKGIAHIGIGVAKGDDRASEAVKMAVESPLLETKIDGATNVLINITGGAVGIHETNIAVSAIKELTGDDVNVIFGWTDDQTTDTCTVTVIATGIEDKTAPPKSGALGNYKTGGGRSLIPPSAALPKTVGAGVDDRPRQPRPAVGINRPGDIKSTVEERQIKIPDFLQKNKENK